MFYFWTDFRFSEVSENKCSIRSSDDTRYVDSDSSYLLVRYSFCDKKRSMSEDHRESDLCMFIVFDRSDEIRKSHADDDTENHATEDHTDKCQHASKSASSRKPCTNQFEEN